MTRHPVAGAAQQPAVTSACKALLVPPPMPLSGHSMQSDCLRRATLPHTPFPVRITVRLFAYELSIPNMAGTYLGAGTALAVSHSKDDGRLIPAGQANQQFLQQQASICHEFLS
jgi:hypothetical protein